jgi:hypothetical protein
VTAIERPVEDRSFHHPLQRLDCFKRPTRATAKKRLNGVALHRGHELAEAKARIA